LEKWISQHTELMLNMANKPKKPKPETYSWNSDKMFEEKDIPPKRKRKKVRKPAMITEQTKLPDYDYVWGEALDAAFFTAITIRLTTPVRQLPAFKMGLINAQGKILKEPMTKEERRALTHIDRIALFMRQAMGGRVAAIMNMYRRRRMTPQFVQAAARALSLRFNKYYDMRIGFYERPFPQAITGGRGPTQTAPGRPRS